MGVYVYAIGGNALHPPGSKKSTRPQALINAVQDIIYLLNNGNSVVLTHGNGPQVGSLMMGATGPSSLNKLYEWVAATQSMIGLSLVIELEKMLSINSRNEKVCIIPTRVLVNHDDSSFQNPTKPVGGILRQTEIEAYQWDIANTIDGPRRVVASPPPISIIDSEVIIDMIKKGYIVISCGGGGIPMSMFNGEFIGVPAVVDKDLTSALLAEVIAADGLIIATGIDAVYNNFNSESQQKISQLNCEDANQKLLHGEFPKGSMAPKIKACISAARNGIDAYICQSGEIEDVLKNKEGTHIFS